MGVKNIDWEDITETIPAFLKILMVPLTAEGLAVAFIMYPIVEGRCRQMQGGACCYVGYCSAICWAIRS